MVIFRTRTQAVRDNGGVLSLPALYATFRPDWRQEWGKEGNILISASGRRSEIHKLTMSLEIVRKRTSEQADKQGAKKGELVEVAGRSAHQERCTAMDQLLTLSASSLLNVFRHPWQTCCCAFE